MKNFALFTFFVLIFKLSVCQNDNDMNQTIYQFKVKDITGKTFDFDLDDTYTLERIYLLI